jgi:hypothetical protein
MDFYFVRGHCFFGMPAYLSGMGTQMEGRLSQQLSMSSSVDCKSTLEDVWGPHS